MALPQPLQTELPEIELGAGRLAFPRPMLQMPHELNRDSAPDYVQLGDRTLVSLPIYVRCEVLPLSPDTECMLIATKNCQPWSRGGDGLTAYSSVNRVDFTFRSGIFAGFPRVRRHSFERLRPSEWNELSMVLSDHAATYWINGIMVASASFQAQEVPDSEVYLGLISYITSYRIRGFDVSRDPAVLQQVCTLEDMRTLGVFKQKVLTLSAQEAEDEEPTLGISCTNLAGENLATFQRCQAFHFHRVFFRQKLAGYI